MPATAIAPAQCVSHLWTKGDATGSTESKIPGVHLDRRFSVGCVQCNEMTTKLTSEICPRCFTTMEHKRVDTEVSRFKEHPDDNTDKFRYAVVHTCPTCSFRCVSFIWDK